MMAVILVTLFPKQKIVILDKRPSHVRNHGLKIWNSNISGKNNLKSRYSTKSNGNKRKIIKIKGRKIF
jgi:hypothetical protein